MSVLRGLRTRAGLTQAQLAAVAGRTQSAVSAWEAGDGLPDEAAVKAMAPALGEPEADVRCSIVIEHAAALAAALERNPAALRSPRVAAAAKTAAGAVAFLANDQAVGDEGRTLAGETLAALADAAAKATAFHPDAPPVPAGSPLDPNFDLRNLRVAADGEGNFSVIDSTTGERVGGVTFGDLVDQAANKAAAGEDDLPRDLFGRRLHPRPGSRRDAAGKAHADVIEYERDVFGRRKLP